MLKILPRLKRRKMKLRKIGKDKVLWWMRLPVRSPKLFPIRPKLKELLNLNSLKKRSLLRWYLRCRPLNRDLHTDLWCLLQDSEPDPDFQEPEFQDKECLPDPEFQDKECLPDPEGSDLKNTPIHPSKSVHQENECQVPSSSNEIYG